ncbi:MAG: phosphoribosylformylglycinamidine synthase subunit PurS [Candidatus Micrarchaeota archaeon]|nr:phosphoribosylformylglycinamidine synthase subunit PurS [Candidatus Micrarchaeota archaeon]
MVYRVEISLKPGVLDAEGNAASQGLRGLGFRVGRVNFSKVYLIEFNGSKAEMEEMCRRFLANPIIQDYSVEPVGVKTGGKAGAKAKAGGKKAKSRK